MWGIIKEKLRGVTFANKTSLIRLVNKEWRKIETELIEFVNYYEKIYFSIFLQDVLLQKIISNINIMEKIPSSNLNFTICEYKKMDYHNIIVFYFFSLVNSYKDIILISILNIVNIFINNINLNSIIK